MVKKILVLVTALGIFLSVPIFAQETKENAIHFELRVKLGLFVPSDSDARDIFRGISSFGIECSYLFPRKPYGISGGFEYSSKSRAILPLMDATWKVMPVTINLLYFPNPEKKAYFGIGLGVYTAKIVGRTWGVNRTIGYPAFGPHIIAGYNFKDHFFVEGRISSVDVGHKDWKKDIGGISLWGGYRIKDNK